ISVVVVPSKQNLPEFTRGMSYVDLPADELESSGKGTLDKGNVMVIDNQVDQTTGTVKLRSEFPNNDLQLWPGQFVNVRVLIDTLRQAVVVPTAAIQRGPNGAFVYVLKQGNTVTVRPVTLTQQDDSRAVVATGLQASEQVVTTGFARLTEGAQVAVSDAENAGQIAPAGQSRPDGARGKRGSEKGKGSPSA